MARYLGPKHKLCRRLGSCIWGSPKCPSKKRPFRPGQHGRDPKGKLSVYARQLLAKQKIRMHYGLMERQMWKTFQEAKRITGDTGVNLIRLLECRLDTVVYRLGFAPTISSARQLVTHCHFLVNGKKVNIPSFIVKPGMKITVREKSRNIPMIAEGAENPYQGIPPHLSREAKSFEGHVVSVPAEENLPFLEDTPGVIGFYSR